MRVAISTLAMRRELYGVGNYVKNLVLSLSKLDQDNEYLLFASEQNAHHLRDLGSNFRIEYAPGNRFLRLPWEQIELPMRLKQERIDVYHGPTFVAPFVKTCRQIVSILDMTFHLTPEKHSVPKRVYFRTMIPRMVRRSDKVIAISESTKRDLIDLLAIKEEKICVTHLGVDKRFQPVTQEQELARVRQKYSLPSKYILFVGLIEPRKNLEALVDAYHADSLHTEFDLVLAGNRGWGYTSLLEKIANSRVRNRIRMPGYVADSDLPALFSMAVAFVYPSVYEGFGLPVLEAMACGTPVITSQVSSLPEVAGDAAILVDPSDPKALASALQNVLGEDHLRKSLSERGIQRARLFTWEKTAQKTLEVYLEVYKGMPEPQ
jgi:glycosyltransferase involved in cell wall biosynthesis